jgi:hypothetical protein
MHCSQKRNVITLTQKVLGCRQGNTKNLDKSPSIVNFRFDLVFVSSLGVEVARSRSSGTSVGGEVLAGGSSTEGFLTETAGATESAGATEAAGGTARARAETSAMSGTSAMSSTVSSTTEAAAAGVSTSTGVSTSASTLTVVGACKEDILVLRLILEKIRILIDLMIEDHGRLATIVDD